jgi:hypothetical protein
VSDPSCRCGAALENLKHFFLDCPIYLQAGIALSVANVTICDFFSLLATEIGFWRFFWRLKLFYDELCSFSTFFALYFDKKLAVE